MNLDKVDKLEAAKFLVQALPTLTSNFVFLNAIFRNIASGENTVAYHKEPYEIKQGLFGTGGSEIRYSGYIPPTKAQLEQL